MKLRKGFTPFIISVSTVALITLCILIASAASCSGSCIHFCEQYFFVCYRMETNAVSASSVSDAVSSYGGAGYILEYDGIYYITVSCYYSNNDAESVCKTLKNRGLNCSVLEVSTDEYKLKTPNAKKCAELYLGNLNTLNSLSRLAYDCANSIDGGSCSQINAKNIISDISSGLNGLINANGTNCFSVELRRLDALCADISEGYVHSKDLRKLQIAIADTIINIELV